MRKSFRSQLADKCRCLAYLKPAPTNRVSELLAAHFVQIFPLYANQPLAVRAADAIGATVSRNLRHALDFIHDRTGVHVRSSAGVRRIAFARADDGVAANADRPASVNCHGGRAVSSPAFARDSQQRRIDPPALDLAPTTANAWPCRSAASSKRRWAGVNLVLAGCSSGRPTGAIVRSPSSLCITDLRAVIRTMSGGDMSVTGSQGHPIGDPGNRESSYDQGQHKKDCDGPAKKPCHTSHEEVFGTRRRSVLQGIQQRLSQKSSCPDQTEPHGHVQRPR